MLSLFCFFASRRRHTRWPRDWSSDVCSSDLAARTTSDLWAGSHLLSRLSWEAMRPLCEQLGPDAILFPRLRGIPQVDLWLDRKSTRLNSSHVAISYAVFCLKKKITTVTEYKQ